MNTRGVHPIAPEVYMEARYNWIIDSTPIRLVINAAAFAIWFGAAFSLMFFAIR